MLPAALMHVGVNHDVLIVGAGLNEESDVATAKTFTKRAGWEKGTHPKGEQLESVCRLFY